MMPIASGGRTHTGIALLVLILSVSLRLAAASDLYVSPNGLDTNAGTSAAPFHTIAKAGAVATAGTTVHVARGTYSTGPFTTNASGTAAARIRYVADDGWNVQVRTNGTNMHIAWSNNGSYVDIEGFDISCNGRIGLYNGGSFCRVIGNHVHDIPAADVGGSGGGGIVHGNYSASDNDTIGNTVDHIGPAVSVNTVQGIYHSNLRGHILKNISYKNSAWGIHTWHAANQVTIANNLIFSNGKGGIIVGAGDSPGGVTADNFLVSNNICLYNATNAITEYGATGANNKYVNNLIWGNGSGIVVKVQTSGTISADPKFINFQADGSGNYHLTAASPCIDTGTSQGAPTTDFDGVARPLAAR